MMKVENKRLYSSFYFCYSVIDEIQRFFIRTAFRVFYIPVCDVCFYSVFTVSFSRRERQSGYLNSTAKVLWLGQTRGSDPWFWWSSRRSLTSCVLLVVLWCKGWIMNDRTCERCTVLFNSCDCLLFLFVWVYFCLKCVTTTIRTTSYTVNLFLLRFLLE